VTTKRAKAAGAPDLLHHAKRLQKLIAELGVEAMTFTAKPKVEDTANQWLARANLDPDDPHSADTVAQALMRAFELATFAPSLSGSTAIDRLVRQRNRPTERNGPRWRLCNKRASGCCASALSIAMAFCWSRT
jgi:hypothetical protein